MEIITIINDDDEMACLDAIIIILFEAVIRTSLLLVLKGKGRYCLLRYTSFT
jgi:hypothetical protein